MRATAIEFRLRMPINAVIIVLGFWAPWIEVFGIGSRISLLEWLALEVSRARLLTFTFATPAVIIAAALVAGFAAVLRVWGTAYLGPGTVTSAHMKAEHVMAAGPYRFVRNPLYLGVWGMVAGMSIVMPPSGALVSLLLVTVFLLRLIFGEEAFLSAKLGAPYQAYLARVPRLLPSLRTGISPSDAKPDWVRGVLSELLPIGVFLAIAVVSWSYDNRLVGRVILISLGVSMVVRALMPPSRTGQAEATNA
ncbi:MAG TPA: isoprenylcysteine carboxylmethyltransferase family protein [Terracidiphilus sp.]|nr:isoprenylcysteine carboxylmethyltransferase family protein [Terracidiphilus sp.]